VSHVFNGDRYIFSRDHEFESDRVIYGLMNHYEQYAFLNGSPAIDGEVCSMGSPVEAGGWHRGVSIQLFQFMFLKTSMLYCY